MKIFATFLLFGDVSRRVIAQHIFRIFHYIYQFVSEEMCEQSLNYKIYLSKYECYLRFVYNLMDQFHNSKF